MGTSPSPVPSDSPRKVPGTITVDRIPQIGEQLIASGQDLGEVLASRRIEPKAKADANYYVRWDITTPDGIFDVQLPRNEARPVPVLLAYDAGAEIQRILRATGSAQIQTILGGSAKAPSSTPRKVHGTITVDRIPQIGEHLIVSGQDLGEVLASRRIEPKANADANHYLRWDITTPDGIFDVQLPR